MTQKNVEERLEKTVKDVNEKIWNLWQDTPEKIRGNLIPYIYRPYMIAGSGTGKKKILFIGFNPSFSKKALTGIYKKILKRHKQPRSFRDIRMLYKWESEYSRSKLMESTIPRDVFEAEKMALDWYGPYDYFAKPYEIAKEFGAKAAHIDLFFVRDTDQKKIEKSYVGPYDFYARQLLESLRLIEMSKPDVIVVINAAACRIFKLFHEKRIAEAKEDVGFSLYRIKKNKYAPLLFSGMLSGGHLDNGSYGRLKWHIKKALAWIPGKKLEWI